MDVLLGNLLRAGVLLSAAVTAVGGAVYLYRHAEETPNYREFDGGAPPELRHLFSVVGEALHGRGRGVVQLGLLLLIATPVARVAFSVFAFARLRDWTYVALTLFVLGVLLFSLFHGGGG
jgi:uncharacterized membrane protein